MEAQIVIELAGGVAEAIYRGERRPREILRFAKANCCVGIDLEHAKPLLGDLFHLTGVHYGEQPFAERALALLLAHWPAVEALASALIEDRRIEGHWVERIIDQGLIGSRRTG
jgi:hypothetical protein